MKTRHILIALLALPLSFSLTACSDDDDEQTVIEEPAAPLAFSTDTLTVGVGESATFDITSGGGDYRVLSENPEVATATISGQTVTVNALEKGITAILVSDARGQYKRLAVKSMYFTMTLDRNAVSLGMKLGHTDGTATLTVTGGNGGYTATSANEDVVRVQSISGNQITLQGVTTGETTVIVRDMMGLTATATVTIAVTDVPYTDDEKAALLASSDNTIVFDGNEGWSGYGDFTAKTEDGQVTAEWNYYDYYYLRLTYAGSLAVGKYTGATMTDATGWGDATVYDDVTVEVLRNDGTRVWGIMSTIKDGYLHYGHFCLPLE